MKVIFLDFDGVVVCLPKERGKTALGKSVRNANPEPVGHLNAIIAATGAKVVVSSTWRLHPGGIPYLDGTLRRAGFEGEIIDVTPRLDGERGDEIAEWLIEHPEADPYVVLDDDNDMGKIPPRHWVLVHKGWFSGGLQAQHAERAIAVLNEAE